MSDIKDEILETLNLLLKQCDEASLPIIVAIRDESLVTDGKPLPHLALVARCDPDQGDKMAESILKQVADVRKYCEAVKEQEAQESGSQ